LSSPTTANKQSTDDEPKPSEKLEMNTVELKGQRSKLRAERKLLADQFRERDMSDDDKAKFDDLTSQIEALSSRIDAIEKVENDDEPMEDDDDPDGEKTKEEGGDRSKPAPATKRHFHNIATSKTRKDSHEYSISRALSVFNDHKRVDGIEGERSQEIALTRGKPQGFYMPWDVKLRGRHKVQNRDLTLTTGTGSVGILVEPTLIELLRARLVFEQLGGTVIPNCVGKFALPRQTAASQYYFVGEATSVTAGNPVIDQVNFVPKTMGISVPITRKFLFESSLDAMTVVEQDVVKSLTVGLDATALAGSGSGATPTGVLNQSSVTTITLAADSANGGVMTYADALAFETAVANSNADQGSLGWATTPGVRAKLKQTPKIGSTFPVFVWSDENQVNGYPAMVTTNMPKNLTKGTGTNLNSIIFGNWNDAVLAMWSGIDVVIDPYTQAAAGGVIYNALIEVDVQLRHGTSFAVAGTVIVV
jgi:HK97 family phage major capsid protein